jgi:hypothetical protein
LATTRPSKPTKTTPPFRSTTTPCGGNHGRAIDTEARGATEGEVSPGETLDEMDVPGAVVHAVMEAAIATEMRSFVVTGTSRTLFLEWLT